MKSLYICTNTNMLMAVIQIRRFIEVNSLFGISDREYINKTNLE